VFQPIFRPHAQQEVPSEAIFKDTQTKALAKEAIEWRYRLLPYNYTLAYENSTTGIPLMRPVFMEYPKQTDFMDRTDCYFWGPDMFVVPITEKGQKIAKIDFPDSNPWFNLYNDERVVPRQFITTARCFWGSRMEMVWNEPTLDSLTMHNIPVFVKAGAFIPMAEKGIQSTEEYSVNKVEVHFYYDPTVSASKGKLFEDDGNSRQDFDGDCYTLFEFDYLKKSAKKSAINVKSTSPYCKPFSPGVTLLIHNVSEVPRIISKTNDQLLGEDTKITFDSTTKTARLIYILEDGNELKIKFH
jgi:alpha-glucosidase (family GH31 glycosyl hydrolase)